MQLSRFGAKRVVRGMARLGLLAPVAWLLARTVEEMPSAPLPPGRRRITVLALNPEFYRGDLDVLSGRGIRVLKLLPLWHARILNVFWPPKMDFTAYLSKDTPAELAAIRANTRAFLRRLLPAFYRRLGVDCVLGTAVHHEQNYDWGTVSEEIGTPYIILQRENFATADKHVEHYAGRMARYEPFRGRHIIVHNDVMREIFVAAGYVPADRISALGCLRMDDFLRSIPATGIPPALRDGRRPLVVLFSFNHAAGLLGVMNAWSPDGTTGWIALFDEIHGALARLARSRPDIDFVVKPKWAGRWTREIERAFREAGVEPASIPNVVIDADVDAHALMRRADVVVSFNSTTMIEAAIAGKPVIVPYFAEAAAPEYAGYIQLREHMHLFDVAKSGDDLIALVLDRLEQPAVSEECLAARRVLFGRYVSPLEANAVERYLAVIEAAAGGGGA